MARAAMRLLRRYRLDPADVEAIVAEAVKCLLVIPDERILDPDGLFLRIADRRAQDLIERRHRDAALGRLLAAALPSSVDSPERRADIYLRTRSIARLRIPRISTQRLAGLVRAIAGGQPPDQALASRKIPRGSRSRYLVALRLLIFARRLRPVVEAITFAYLACRERLMPTPGPPDVTALMVFCTMLNLGSRMLR